MIILSKHHKSEGFAHLLIIIGVVLALVVGGVAALSTGLVRLPAPPGGPASIVSDLSKGKLGPQSGPGGCKSEAECNAFCTRPENEAECSKFIPPGGEKPKGEAKREGPPPNEEFKDPFGHKLLSRLCPIYFETDSKGTYWVAGEEKKYIDPEEKKVTESFCLSGKTRDDFPKITLGLPFDKSDLPAAISPMGETLDHPKPKNPFGHPGIDFIWQHPKARVLAVADGVVSAIKYETSEPKTWDVGVLSGKYLHSYDSLGEAAGGLKIGQQIKKGEVVGYSSNTGGGSYYHFRIGIMSGDAIFPHYKELFCPMTSFESAAKVTIENIWAGMPATDRMKSRFPNICSGDYLNKEEPPGLYVSFME